MSKNGKLIFKTYDPYITSPFGYREAIYDNNGKLVAKAGGHNGVDYGTNANKLPQYAITDGVVIGCGTDSTKAKYVYVQYDKLGYIGLHYHLDSINVKNGQKVNENTVIGKTGMTGNTTGIHLHYGWYKIAEHKKAFNSRKWEDFEAYNYSGDVKVTPVVDRNESINQIKVVASQLRVRTEHNTTSTAIGYAVVNGIYNCYETYKDANYTWYRIADNQWIASDGTWVEVLEVIDYKKLYEELKVTTNNMQKTIMDLEDRLHKINELSQ